LKPAIHEALKFIRTVFYFCPNRIKLVGFNKGDGSWRLKLCRTISIRPADNNGGVRTEGTFQYLVPDIFPMLTILKCLHLSAIDAKPKSVRKNKYISLISIAF